MAQEQFWHYGMAFILGTLFGSFANVCIYRFPQRLSPVFPGSHCPSCQEALHRWHDIPVLSYVLSVGVVPRWSEHEGTGIRSPE